MLSVVEISKASERKKRKLFICSVIVFVFFLYLPFFFFFFFLRTLNWSRSRKVFIITITRVKYLTLSFVCSKYHVLPYIFQELHNHHDVTFYFMFRIDMTVPVFVNSCLKKIKKKKTSQALTDGLQFINSKSGSSIISMDEIGTKVIGVYHHYR